MIAKLFVIALTMTGLDFVWLSIIAPKFYKSQIGSLLLEKPNMVAAVLFYIIYVIGIYIFAVSPALADGDWKKAAMLGAAFGFVAYATYDLTNLATLKGFTNTVVVVDMLWGTLLTGSVSAASFLIIDKWL